MRIMTAYAGGCIHGVISVSVLEFLFIFFMTGEAKGTFFFDEESGFIRGMRKMTGHAVSRIQDLVHHHLLIFFPVMALITEPLDVCFQEIPCP